MRGDLFDVDPTVITAGSYAGGDETVEQPGPSFPAETDMKMPAARNATTALENVSRAHPSLFGHPYELPIACGRNSGFGFIPYVITKYASS
jgi:hypothetical protein